jgi:hypothetical protein
MCARCKIRAFNFMDPPNVVANNHVKISCLDIWLLVCRLANAGALHNMT